MEQEPTQPRCHSLGEKAGEEPPSPDKWTTAFQILTPMVITLTILMIIKWVRRAG